MTNKRDPRLVVTLPFETARSLEALAKLSRRSIRDQLVVMVQKESQLEATKIRKENRNGD
jgi:hypothetical protein